MPDVASPESAVAVLEEEKPLVFKVSGLDIRESYVTILDRHSNQNVVTVIELVSPANKYAGPGRKAYTTKQQEVLRSDAHLVEIDLLRMGPHVVSVPEYGSRGKAGAYDYLMCINRAGELRDEFEFYPCRLRRRLPRSGFPRQATTPTCCSACRVCWYKRTMPRASATASTSPSPAHLLFRRTTQILADQPIQQAGIVASWL